MSVVPINFKLDEKTTLRLSQFQKIHGYGENRSEAIRYLLEFALTAHSIGENSSFDEEITKIEKDITREEESHLRTIDQLMRQKRKCEQLKKAATDSQTVMPNTKNQLLDRMAKIPYLLSLRRDLKREENVAWFRKRGNTTAKALGITVVELELELSRICSAVDSRALVITPELGGKLCQVEILDPNWRNPSSALSSSKKVLLTGIYPTPERATDAVVHPQEERNVICVERSQESRSRSKTNITEESTEEI